MKTIRGVRVLREPYTPPPHVEHLRYSLDVYDERDNLVEVLGRLADLAVAHAAFDAAVAKYPGKRIFLRERARVIRRYDEPRG
jgi:hypothetical protein